MVHRHWNLRSHRVPQGSISPHFMSSACLLGKPENKTAGPSPTVKTAPREAALKASSPSLCLGPAPRAPSVSSWSPVPSLLSLVLEHCLYFFKMEQKACHGNSQ